MTPTYNEEPDHDWWQTAVLIMFALMCLGMCTGCKTKYIPYDVYHTEYVTQRDTIARHDSVHLHDSVLVQYVGDTVQIIKYHTALRYRDRYITRHDTLIIRDTLPATSQRAAHAALAQQAAAADQSAHTPWYATALRYLTYLLILATMCLLAVGSAFMKKWHDGK